MHHSATAVSSASSPAAHLSQSSPLENDMYVDPIPRRGSGPRTSRLIDRPSSRGFRVHAVRAMALLCACSLSVGSHYATYILGPIKTRLSREMGTSNTEFSLLIAAFSLNSTWTPLLGGFLAGRLGTTSTSIIATGLIFIGQAILLFGDILESVRLMTFGMFVFGLGVSPLSVVQESIIVRFFKDHGLGLSMAIGLVMGKAASFASARTSYPLSERYGPRAPFYVATFLAGGSFTVNLIYLMASKWLVMSSGTELEASELHEEARNVQAESVSEAQALKRVAEKRTVHVRDITKLGDVFWAYIGINILCGAIWTPFTHLAPNIFEQRYNLTELEASNQASLLLAASVFLYPICGFIIDKLKHRPILHQMFLVSSSFTMACYLWLFLPPSFTKRPGPAIALYAFGQGFAPLLLVIIVPTLVSSNYIPTTLGAHKSLEQTGSTIFQTFAGIFLDTHKPDTSRADVREDNTDQLRAIQQLLGCFLFLNVCQLCGIMGLWALDRRRKRQAAALLRTAPGLHQPYIAIPEEADAEPDVEDSPKTSRNRLSFVKERRSSESHSLQRRDTSFSGQSSTVSRIDEAMSESLHGREESRTVDEEERPLLNDEPLVWHAEVDEPVAGEALTKSEHIRGEAFGVVGICLIAFAWVFFLWTAFLTLRSKGARQGDNG